MTKFNCKAQQESTVEERLSGKVTYNKPNTQQKCPTCTVFTPALVHAHAPMHMRNDNT